MTPSHLLSVCCLGYNHAKYITDNLQAIWKSKYKQIEIIVVDDGSTDGTVGLLKELVKQSPFPMKLILQKNTGNIGHNLNLAWKQASGEFITFIAMDDVLYSEAIDHAMALFQQEPNLAFIASSKITIIDEKNKIIEEQNTPIANSKQQLTPKNLLDIEFTNLHSFYIQGCFFRKTIVDAVHGFDEDMTGDDIVLRTKIYRYLEQHPTIPFKFVSRPLCYYRQHAQAVHLNVVRQIKIVTEYLEKYWPNTANPSILEKWMMHAIDTLPFDKVFSLFAMNGRSAALLGEPEIQKKIIWKIRKENSPWRYIFKKERQGKARKITLFSFIHFNYNHR